MNDQHSTDAARSRRPQLSNITSAIALSVSVFALAIGAWQTRLMQNQARASVWPYLSIGYTYSNDTDENAFIWRIDNNGVGPARVQRVDLSLDGHPMKHWTDVLIALGFKGKLHLSTPSTAGEVIPPSLNRETAIEPIHINDRDVGGAFKNAVERFRMDICYCSVYDDCWIARWQVSKADRVESCDARAGGVSFED